MMNTMLNALVGQSCLVYLDDVIVYGKTLQECLERLETVLQRLRNYGLKLKTTKCHLFKKEVEYLGRIVSEQGVRTDPEKVLTWPQSFTVWV